MFRRVRAKHIAPKCTRRLCSFVGGFNLALSTIAGDVMHGIVVLMIVQAMSVVIHGIVMDSYRPDCIE